MAPLQDIPMQDPMAKDCVYHPLYREIDMGGFKIRVEIPAGLDLDSVNLVMKDGNRILEATWRNDDER